MVPIKYQVVGEEEYAFRLEIDSQGTYSVDTGTYTTQKPRSGKLTPQQTADLMASVKALGIPDEYHVICIVALGYRGPIDLLEGRPREYDESPRTRKPLNEVIAMDRFEF